MRSAASAESRARALQLLRSPLPPAKLPHAAAESVRNFGSVFLRRVCTTNRVFGAFVCATLFVFAVTVYVSARGRIALDVNAEHAVRMHGAPLLPAKSRVSSVATSQFTQATRAPSPLATQSLIPLHSFRLNASLPRLRILVYKSTWDESCRIAARGGPGGELAMYRSLLASLERLRSHHVEIRHATTVDALKTTKVEQFDVIFSDQYSQDDFRLAHGAFMMQRKCRFRMIDFWGTPPEQNGLEMHLKQYLTPYRNPWNQLLGFITPLNAPLGNHPMRKSSSPFHVLLHGKARKYFEPPYLAALSQLPALLTAANVRVVFHMTVVDAPGEVLLAPEARHAFKNHGNVNATEWRRLLREARCVIGGGHPVNAPTAIEAIASGAAYIAARYDVPLSISDLPRHPLTTQHDFVVGVSAPYAFASSVTNAAQLAATVRRCLDAPFAPRVLPDFDIDQHAQRLQDEILAVNACE